MQQYYGDKPHIISRKSKKRPKKRRGRTSGRVRAVLIGLCVVCAAVFLITVFAVYPSRDVIRLKAEKWYYVSLYSPTEIVEAELNAQSLKETGGAGYIINDGTFRVTAFVYDSSSDAKAVADKQTLTASVYTVALPEVKIDAVKDESTSKQVKEGFSVHGKVYDDIVSVLNEFDRGQTTESAMLHAVTTVRSYIVAERERQQAIYNETSSTAVNALCDYLDSAVQSLDIAMLGENNGLASRIRYALCEIIYNRYMLAAALN